MADVDDGRHFKNPYPDCSRSDDAGIQLVTADHKLCTKWSEKLIRCIKDLLGRLEHGLKNDPNSVDSSVYTGSAGIAMLYLLLHSKLDQSQAEKKAWLEKGLKLLEPALKHPKGKRVTFLCGDTGLFAVGALYYYHLQRDKDVTQLISKVLSQSSDVLSHSACDEVLFGRAGYLYSLLFLQKHFGHDAVPKESIDQVVSAIIESGRSLAKKDKSKCPLMYMWHDSYYLGAAHGLAGIFFMLMKIPNFGENKDLWTLVKGSIDYQMSLRFPSGNYPSSLRSMERDKLVHWCHGSPGFIHMFLQAYKVFGEDVYLKEAMKCGEAIWARGLLMKGYGLCHGVAGNGYAHLMLWQATKDQKYLYRALKGHSSCLLLLLAPGGSDQGVNLVVQWSSADLHASDGACLLTPLLLAIGASATTLFAEWIFDYGTHGCRIADRPYSLFEGMAGTIYFLVDLLNPGEAAFPAFYL